MVISQIKALVAGATLLPVTLVHRAVAQEGKREREKGKNSLQDTHIPKHQINTAQIKVKMGVLCLKVTRYFLFTFLLYISCSPFFSDLLAFKRLNCQINTSSPQNMFAYLDIFHFIHCQRSPAVP